MGKENKKKSFLFFEYIKHHLAANNKPSVKAIHANIFCMINFIKQ